MVQKAKIFRLILLGPKEDKGARKKVTERCFLLVNADGTIMEKPAAGAMIDAIKKRLPPTWTLEITEEVLTITNELSGFEANCPQHGARPNEFFCGLCGKPLTPAFKV